MDQFNFGAFAKELSSVEERGITFEDKALTWETADDVKDVVEALGKENKVTYMKLEGNTLGVSAAEAIGKALEKHPEFKKALWRNMFTRRLKTEIPQALKHLGKGLMVADAQLTVLDLSDNALGPNGMVGIENLLRSRVCYSLKELHLNNCGLGIGGGRMLSKALLDCHSYSTEAGTPLSLKVFVTGRNRLENDGAAAIANIFSTITTLEEIRMPQNSIFHKGIEALAQGLKKNKNLQILNLNDNIIGVKGAKVLAEALDYMPKLKEINLGDCLLKTKGAYRIAEALESKKLLETVDLSFNEIGIDGGLIITATLQDKPHLKLVNLDGNQFGDDGCDRIRECMFETKNPSALASLDEDEGENEDEEDDEDASENDEEEDDGEEGEYDDDDDADDKHNETTEEFDEDDYQDESVIEDEGNSQVNYVTAFSSKLLDSSDIDTSLFSKTQNATIDTIEEFCLSQMPCSLKTFESLKDGTSTADFKKFINKFSDDEYLIVLVFTALKCAHLSQVSEKALNIAIELYIDSFKHAQKINQISRVMNFYLQQMGMLRFEQKEKTPFDEKNCRYAFRETLKKNQLPEEVKNTFTVFLDKYTD